MKKAKRLVALSVLASTLGVVAIAANQIVVVNGEPGTCQHDLHHHAAVAPLDETPGNIEYWACCECHGMYKDATATQEIGNITADITDPSDGRYVAPKMTPLDFGTHKKNQWGNWTTSGNSGTVNDPNPWNNFLTTDIKASAGQTIRFSADIAVTQGFIHVCTGINDFNDPGAGWFSLVIDTAGDTVRLGAEKKGTMGAFAGLHAYQMEYGAASETHKYMIECYANGRIYGYVDGVKFCECYDSAYAGGYLALANYNGIATFSNVRYEVYDDAVTTFEIPENTPYNAKGYATTYNWGTWTFGDSSVTAANSGNGNVFSMSSLKQKADQDLVMEADVSIKGNCAALVYGITAINDPGAGWYSFMLSGNAGNVRPASENKGTIGIGQPGHAIPSTDWKQSTEEAVAHIKVSALASGVMTYYLNGAQVATLTDTSFNGGFIGFLTFYSSVTFSNIKISITNVVK